MAKTKELSKDIRNKIAPLYVNNFSQLDLSHLIEQNRDHLRSALPVPDKDLSLSSVLLIKAKESYVVENDKALQEWCQRSKLGVCK